MDPQGIDVFGQVSDIVTSFDGGWYLGVAAILFILVQFVKGKFGLKIPYVTEWLEGKGAAAKTYIIWGLLAVAGGLVSLSQADWTIWKFFNGALAGLAVGLGSSGAHTGVTQTIEAVKNWRKDGK